MKLRRGLLSTLFVFMVLLTLSSVTYAGQSDMETAKELIYGNWAKNGTDWIKYKFNENNIKIENIYEVNPMGESRFKVKIKNSAGNWIGFNTMLMISLEKERYTMYIIKRRENGNQVLDGDGDVKYVKVYWED